MRKYYLVRGKKGVLVGDPWKQHGFIGQAPVHFEKGQLPKLAADRWKPCLAVIPKHPEVFKPLQRKQLEIVKEFQANNIKEAMKQLQVEQPPAPKATNGDSK